MVANGQKWCYNIGVLKREVNFMFYFGQFEHSLDNKYRVRIPSRLREIMVKNETKFGIRGEGEPYAYITKGNDGNLVILPASTFQKINDKIQSIGITKDNHKQLQVFMAGVFPIDEDGQGRFTLNANLRKFAKIEKDVVFVGESDRITLWNRSAWEAFENSCSATDGLDMFGIY